MQFFIYSRSESFVHEKYYLKNKNNAFKVVTNLGQIVKDFSSVHALSLLHKLIDINGDKSN